MPSKTPSRKRAARAAQPRLATRMVHGGSVRSQFGETSEALFLTSGYSYESAEQVAARFREDEAGYLYSRFGNPTVRMLEERLMALEGAEDARATTTGMAAVMASMFCFLRSGDHVVSSHKLFSSCRYIIVDLLPRFGVASTLVEGQDLAQWKKAVRPNTRAFFLESPANPTLDVIDIAAVARIARAAGAKLIVDNTFTTPVLQRPLELGADIAVYSATKHMDGQGRLLGGAVLGSRQYVSDHLANYVRQTGPTLSAFNAWALLKALETLPLRMAQHCATAAKLADFLAAHKNIVRVYYPHRKDHPDYKVAKKQMQSGGSLIAMELQGGQKQAFRFLNALRLIKISNNLGDTKSLITHPATTTHQKLPPAEQRAANILPSSVRLSVGLEDVADLQEDLEQALCRI